MSYGYEKKEDETQWMTDWLELEQSMDHTGLRIWRK